MSSLARRQRRELARKLGYRKENETLKERSERMEKTNEMGKRIHLNHLETIKNTQLDAKRERDRHRLIAETKKYSDADITFPTTNEEAFDFLKDVDELPKASDENENVNNE